MKKYKVLAIILLGVFVCNCSGTKETLLSINEDALKAQYFQKDKLSLEIVNPKNQKIDSIVYSLNNKQVGDIKGSGKFTFELKKQKLGYQNIKATIYSDGEIALDSTRIEIISDFEPKLLSYTILNTYPHDTAAYTLGLEFYRDTLYEGTGNGVGNGTGIRGVSSLRKTDYKTGKVYKKI